MINSNPFLANPISNQHITQRREKNIKLDSRYIQEIRNAELINKKLLIHKKGVLPSLQLSSNKKSFNNLLSPYQKSDYSPVRRYQHPQYSDKQAKNFYNHAEIYASRIQKIVQRKELCNSVSEQKKIGKSFSQSKQVGHLEEISDDTLLAIKRPQHRGKMATEQSATSASSKQIYQRLNRLRNKDKIMSLHQPIQIKDKDNLKQYKHSSFVLKFKVAQSHHQEKSQLRTLKNSRNDNPAKNLRENIKIKNYTKFFSNDFDLQN